LLTLSAGEALIGDWFSKTGRRSEIFLATKFGSYDPNTTDYKPISQPAHIRAQFQTSLKKLQTTYVDLYYQHRVDPNVPIEVVLETLAPLVESGQIKWIGLSEPSIATLKRAKAVKGVGEKVVAAQLEFSPFELKIEKTGFVEVIKEAGMAVVVHSPFSHGLITGRFRSPSDLDKADVRRTLPRFSPENFPNNLKIVERLKVFADKYRITISQLVLAWILAEHEDFIPIPGIRNVERLEENAHAANINLFSDDVKAIRAVVEAAEVVGERLPVQVYGDLTGDCIPVSEWKMK